MPITPLHLAAALPVKQAMKGRFSLGSFIAVNVLIDLEPITVVLLGLEKHGLPLHGIIHTLAGVTLASLLVALFAWRKAWWIGAFFGAYSHLLMDATVHTDVEPFWPLSSGNPLFLGIMEPLSLACLVVVAWYGIPWLMLAVRRGMEKLRQVASKR